MAMNSICGGQRKQKIYIRDSTNLHFGNFMKTTLDASTIKIAKESIKQIEIILLPPSKAPLSELLHYEGEDPETLTNAEECESSEPKKDKDDRIKNCWNKLLFNMNIWL